MDILGLGTVAVDELLDLATYPAADAKVPILRRRRRIGGQTGNALIAAARLGARCAYAGILGKDADSDFACEVLQAEGIDLSHLTRRVETRPIRCTILLACDTGSRTVLYDLTGATPLPETVPDEAVIRSARVLLVDQFGVEGMTRAARIARQSGVAVVGDLERLDQPGVDELLALIDHLILSRDVAAQWTSASEPAAILNRLWRPDCQLAAITDGAAGSWYRTVDGKIVHQPALAVMAVDTTGCGDVFHGTYAAALAWGQPVEERIAFATKAAGLRARDGESPKREGCKLGEPGA